MLLSCLLNLVFFGPAVVTSIFYYCHQMLLEILILRSSTLKKLLIFWKELYIHDLCISTLNYSMAYFSS